MARYFLEVAYKGTAYSGFQIQENARTVQDVVQKAFGVLHRRPVTLTGSSRTDAGVHALQNFFHFDFEDAVHPHFIYKMNAILPDDIVVKKILSVPANAHCRFDAVSREYEYRIYRQKNPFLKDRAYYYPYRLNNGLLMEAANLVRQQTNFFAFAKTNTLVKNFDCTVYECEWTERKELLIFRIVANRFLRGMVRLLTATQLQVGRGKLSMDELAELFKTGKKYGRSVPAVGLFLKGVHYPPDYFSRP